MFWELYQQSQINSAKSSASRAAMKAGQTMEHLRMMEAKIESLALACQALWEILRDNTDLSEEEMLSKMEEIDIRDGRRDGRLSPSAQVCEKCQRTVNRRRAVCIYCGHKHTEAELFGRQ